MILPQFRVSVASACWPLPMLIVARSHVAAVVASARRMNSLHSSSVRMSSMTPAKRWAYLGIGGLVAVKSIWRAEAVGGASEGRKLSDICYLNVNLPELLKCGGLNVKFKKESGRGCQADNKAELFLFPH